MNPESHHPSAKNHEHPSIDELDLKNAFKELPSAETSQHFRARVLAVAALTPQVRPAFAEGTLSEGNWGLSLLLRGGVAALGFTLGLSLFLMLLTLTPAAYSNTNVASHAEEESAVVAFLPALSVDPVETYARRLVAEQDQQP